MKTTFHVPDMVCPSCALRLEGLQDELPGASRLSASYKKLTLEVVTKRGSRWRRSSRRPRPSAAVSNP